MKRAIIACLGLIALLAPAASAEQITLQYVVHITERANVVPIGTGELDKRIGLWLGPSEAFEATLQLTMTFDVLLGQSGGTGFGTGDTALFTLYGMPTFSPIPLPSAAPLISQTDPGIETNFFGQAFEQQAFDTASGSSSMNWGAYLVDTVQLPGATQSGSTTLLTHIMPATFTGPSEFQSVPLATYREHMQGNLDFDFTTWSYYYETGGFTSDSYNYRGTARFIPTTVPEPSTLFLVGISLAGVGFHRARRGHARRKEVSA